MTKRTYVDVEVHFDRITEPDTHTAVTLRGYARLEHGQQIDAWWDITPGPGTGPHMGRDIATLRRLGWACHHLADALEQHAALGHAEPVDDPQLSLADAPVYDGHHPTITIGAHR